MIHSKYFNNNEVSMVCFDLRELQIRKKSTNPLVNMDELATVRYSMIQSICNAFCHLCYWTRITIIMK